MGACAQLLYSNPWEGKAGQGQSPGWMVCSTSSTRNNSVQQEISWEILYQYTFTNHTFPLHY